MKLRVETEVAVITLGAGENRLNAASIACYNSLLDQVESNRVVKALVTTAEGRFFCNGLDLVWLKTQGAAGYRQFWVSLNRVLARLLTFPLPTVAAINGHAFAGGALLAFAHDFRVMRQDKGWLCLNEVLFGGRFPEFLFEIVRQKFPPGPVLRDIVVLGLRLNGKESKSRGLVDDVCSSDQLLTSSMTLVRKCYQRQGIARESMRQMKTDLYHPILIKEHLTDLFMDKSNPLNYRIAKL